MFLLLVNITNIQYYGRKNDNGFVNGFKKERNLQTCLHLTESSSKEIWYFNPASFRYRGQWLFIESETSAANFKRIRGVL